MRELTSVSTRMVYEVPAGAPIRWEANVSGRVRACAGKMWLTRESDPSDYWLNGESLVDIAAGDVLWIGSEGDQPGRLELRFDTPPAHGLRKVWLHFRQWQSARAAAALRGTAKKVA